MPGAFSRLRHSVSNLFQRDSSVEVAAVYDVVGFCDVIVDIIYRGEIEEFFDKVIQKLNSLPEVNKTVSFPVIKRSPMQKVPKMAVTGYMFISAVPLQIEPVQKELVGLDHIISADIIAGEYDLVAKTVTPISRFPECASQVQCINGIKWSRTCIPLDVFRLLEEKFALGQP